VFNFFLHYVQSYMPLNDQSVTCGLHKLETVSTSRLAVKRNLTAVFLLIINMQMEAQEGISQREITNEDQSIAHFHIL